MFLYNIAGRAYHSSGQQILFQKQRVSTFLPCEVELLFIKLWPITHDADFFFDWPLTSLYQPAVLEVCIKLEEHYPMYQSIQIVNCTKILGRISFGKSSLHWVTCHCQWKPPTVFFTLSLCLAYSVIDLKRNILGIRIHSI